MSPFDKQPAVSPPEQHVVAHAVVGVMALEGSTETFDEKQSQEAQPQPQSDAQPLHLRPLELLFWLAVAAVQPVFVALLGVLVRYLEVDTMPPWSPLRVTCAIILGAFPVLLVFHALPLLLMHWWKRRQRQKPCTADATDRSSSSSSSSSSAAEVDEAERGGTRSAPGAAAVAGLARVPTLPGLSQVYDRHPQVHRRLVLLAVSISYLSVILLLNWAPKLLDPATIMLITQFTVVGVAVVGRVWLGVCLQPALLPAAAIMIGGAAMVLVPDMVDGAGEPGSLTTGKAWVGFGASIGALCLTVVYIILLQAFKHANLSAMEVLYWLTGLCAVVVLPISLGVDGTDWAAQFQGMTRSDWAALLFCTLVAHIGSVLGIQWATRKLGGNTVSLFFGMRLIGSVVASKIILGATVVRTGLQVAGVVLVAGSITAYMALQWWAARARQLRSAKA